MRRGVPPSPSIVVQLVLLFQRMRLATFEYILKGIEESIKKFSNFCECISAKQRLAVTLRRPTATMEPTTASSLSPHTQGSDMLLSKLGEICGRTQGLLPAVVVLSNFHFAKF
ncbi:uncharacterized protein LOC143024646 isoform X3 [Oratosquilla oratoria]|uniref:uncharacterized protein LOC143024646 isoform X3 n=1 Tax=Oratosquilla oratoria TaxID=337810 RepID=UPI003F76EF32